MLGPFWQCPFNCVLVRLISRVEKQLAFRGTDFLFRLELSGFDWNMLFVCSGRTNWDSKFDVCLLLLCSREKHKIKRTNYGFVRDVLKQKSKTA